MNTEETIKLKQIGRPKGSLGVIQLDRIIQIRVSETEKLFIKKQAELEGLTVSRYMVRRAMCP